jgi:hypothetical protein
MPDKNRLVKLIIGENMELMEAVAIENSIDLAKDERCPFCHKRPIGHATKNPKEVNDKVTSIPADLNCDNTSSWRAGTAAKRDTGDLPYTIAKHHIISAIQCYAKIRRLVRMGNMVGYDINNPNNGIGLPTTHYSLKYTDGGSQKKYGDLDDLVGKKRVAEALMQELGAQWHVGHHAFVVKAPKTDVDTFQIGGSDEKNEDDYPHETQYDILIIQRLFDFVKSLPQDFCEESTRDDTFKKDLDALSAEIKEKLEKFNGKGGARPADSSPFFVSRRAYEYSKIADQLPNIDLPIKNVSW